MKIRIVHDTISRQEVEALAAEIYGDMIKGVVDIERGCIALGGEMHADAEQVLLDDGSRQGDLWGFNLNPDEPRDNALAYESFINIRPRDGNRQLTVGDEQVRATMRRIIFERIEW